LRQHDKERDVAPPRKKLTAVEVACITKPGMNWVDDGLYLQIKDGGRSWLHRYTCNGKHHSSGLGSYPEVRLIEARAKRDEERALIRKGIDPVAERKDKRTEAILRQIKSITFQECGEAYVKDNEVAWRHPMTQQNWRGPLSTYIYPIIGECPVQDVDKAAVFRVLEQPVDGTKLWFARPPTAGKVRMYIEKILDYAEMRGYRSDQVKNPALLSGLKALPSIKKIHKKKHLRAMPYAEVPELMKKLRARKHNTGRGFGRWPQGSVSARALEFAILTGGRCREVSDARWEEFNLTDRVWTIPADRIVDGIRISGMKSDRAHRVPLSPAAMAVLEEMQGFRKEGDRNSDFVFPGTWRRGGVTGEKLRDLLSRMGHDVTTHGFRASFRSWAHARTNFPREICEEVLAHVVGNATERSYDREELMEYELLLEKRRHLLERWADYCAGLAPVTADVIQLRAASA
jgi:integrase